MISVASTYWRPARLGILAALTCVIVGSGCSSDSKKAGGLVILVESDLSMPKDIDRIRVEASQSGRMLLDEAHDTGPNQLLVPAKFQLGYPGSTQRVLVRALGYKSGRPRIERSAILQIPRDRTGLLRLQLNYLCDGQVNEDETPSCGEEQTCQQGMCTSAEISPDDLPAYEPGAKGAAGSGSDGSEASGCFDVLACFSGAVEVEVDPVTCSFAVADDAQTDRLNVGLKLPLDRPGICGGNACWVALDPGSDGWLLADGQLNLPAAACRQRPGEPAPVVAITTRCTQKQRSTPPCGDWSSVNNRVDSSISADEGADTVALPRARVGNSCEGFAVQACGDCGTRMRTCTAGLWSDWSECTTEGVCSVAASQMCGSDGSQACTSECQWGDCMGQACDGPATRACGNCGTQRRSCDNSVWSDWSECSDEGACKPAVTQACGSGGTQACGGNCQWGGCGEQRCSGAPSEPCGKCGSRTRTCDATSGEWSAWSACSGEGECAADDSRDCGRSGTQVCGGNCGWDAACTGQTCAGSASRQCGNCGVQTRACNMNTGNWSDWSSCQGQGACTPTAKRECGASGEQVCGNDCRWEDACTGQVCDGSPARTCGNCGMQTRSCDGNSGEWLDWSSCGSQGACAPGAKRSCGAGGSQGCGDNCQWDRACTGQVCSGAASRGCGNCGNQTRSCDSNSGSWSDWGACMNQGACAPDGTRSCGAGGTQTCASTCRWNTNCTGQVCSGPQTQACGNCGVQSRSCDSDNAEWSSWSSCSNQGACMPGAARRCGQNMTGTQTCGNNCEWNPACTGQTCSGSATQSCGSCGMQNRTCNPDTGLWSGWSACAGQGSCQPNATQMCGQGNRGKQTCNASCDWGTCILPCEPEMRACGNCGTQMRTCNADGALSDWSTCTNQGACAPDSNRSCNGSGTQSCNDSCQWATCCTPQTEACGNCGMRTRTCNPDGTLGAWSTCNDQGACSPGSNMTCDGSGTRTCNNQCGWGQCCTPQSRACGNCGMQVRTCGADGALSDWSTCVSTGMCAPGATEMCQAGGQRTCSEVCQWGTCCTPQTEACGNCGTRTRGCNADGTPGAWSACSDQGDCKPGDSMTCSAGGSRVCSNSCAWGACCAPEMRTCGNCGTQMRGCNEDGTPGAWSTCTGGGACAPGATQTCNGSGNQTCTSVCAWGDCNCPTGQTTCGTSCVNTSTDPNNCGRCAEKCSAGTTCSAGSCGCPAGQTSCTGSCVDTAGDEANCGMCGVSCGSGETCTAGRCTCGGATCGMGQTCSDGRCACSGSLSLCSGACVDAQTDEANCGACGAACGSGETCTAGRCLCGGATCAAGQTCNAGKCTCPAGQTSCSGSCVDTAVDEANCGMCGVGCGSGETCTAGRCTCGGATCAMGQTCSAGSCTCAGTLSLCSGACVDRQSDEANCGECGAKCAAGESCSAGRCLCGGEACVTGQTCSAGSCTCGGTLSLCGGACVDRDSDEANCGDCGKKCAAGETCSTGFCLCGGEQCVTGQTCSAGSCTCGGTLSLCGGACVDRQSDEANCGDCGTKCATGETCSAGRCLCGNETCGTGQSCSAGQCTCPVGLLLCAGACIDPQTNGDNCGTCGVICSNNQSCTMGRCVGIIR